MRSETDVLRSVLSPRIGFVDEASTLPMGQKKSARWISPRISQRALFFGAIGWA